MPKPRRHARDPGTSDSPQADSSQPAAGESPGASDVTHPARQERIARRAYERYQDRGGQHGDDQQDWFEAEREVPAEDEP